MTAVAALVADGSVWMAADSQMTASGGTVRWPAAPKVWRATVQTAAPQDGPSRDDVLVAMAGAVSLLQAVRHRLSWPKLPAVPGGLRGGLRQPRDGDAGRLWSQWEESLDTWALDVADAVSRLALERRLLADDGDADAAQPAVEGGLLGYDGRLWGLGPWQATRMDRGYEAIGSGGEVATGAMWVQVAQNRHRAAPDDVVRLAVDAAIEWDAGCGGPVQVEQLVPSARAPRRRTTRPAPLQP